MHVEAGGETPASVHAGMPGGMLQEVDAAEALRRLGSEEHSSG
jgi:hypothetical protein